MDRNGRVIIILVLIGFLGGTYAMADPLGTPVKTTGLDTRLHISGISPPGDQSVLLSPVLAKPFSSPVKSPVQTRIQPDTLPLYTAGSSVYVSANFTADPIFGTPPLSVQFTDTSGGKPTSWYWTFGDGSVSHEQNPVHVYTGIGRYTVTLAVRNKEGQSVIRKPAFITPNNGRVTGPNGMIWVTSLPSGARVYVDHQYLGTTPLQSNGIPAGIRQIRVSLDGYLGWTGYVQVSQGSFTYIPKVVLWKL